jgi:hypothetical protein
MNEIDLRRRRYVVEVEDDPGHLLYYSRLVNVNGGAFAIVASLRFYEGELCDWAAYWNGYDPELDRHEGMKFVAAKGNKLHWKDAEYLFSDLPMSNYRE